MPGQARILAAGNTDVGRKRTHNEDFFALVEAEHLYLVADGMGGHSSGEVASQMAINTMSEFFQATSADPEATWPENRRAKRKHLLRPQARKPADGLVPAHQPALK